MNARHTHKNVKNTTEDITNLWLYFDIDRFHSKECETERAEPASVQNSIK